MREFGKLIDIYLLPFFWNLLYTEAAGNGGLFRVFGKFQKIIVIFCTGEAVVPDLVAARKKQIVFLVQPFRQTGMFIKITGWNVLLTPIAEVRPTGNVGTPLLFRKFRKNTAFFGNLVFQPGNIVPVVKWLFINCSKTDNITAESRFQSMADSIILQSVAVVCNIRDGYDSDFHAVGSFFIF